MTAKPLARDGSVPLWQQLQADLVARVRSGEFSGVFPSELDLAGDYRVSRHTVRQALQGLRARGVVTGSRGRPSRVGADTEMQLPVGVLYSLLGAARAAGLSLHSRVRVFGIRADGVVAARLGLEESTPLVYLNRLRFAGDEPLAIDQVWMPASLAEPLLGVDFARASFYGGLAERAGVRLDGGEERIAAVTLTEIQRRQLACPAGAGAFEIRRLGRVRGRPAEWRLILVRGDRFPLTAEFSPRGGYRIVQPQAAPPATA
jgi:GntR family transcriptional regulator